MAINLSSAFVGINNVLNENLSKFTTMRLIGMQQVNNSRYYASGLISKGFYYKKARNPKTGQVLETIKIVPLDDNINDLIASCKMLELADGDGNFLRFAFETDKEPNPPSYQWVLIVKPNTEDVSPIT